MFKSLKKTSYFKVLSNRYFRHLWLSQVFSQLGANILLFVLALGIYQKTGSNTSVSLLFLFYGLPAVLIGLLAGVAVERIDKRFILIICDMMRTVGVLFLLFIVQNPFLVYIYMLYHAVVTQFYVPALSPMIPTLVDKADLVTANSLFSFTYYSSMGLGLILAGPILRLFGMIGAILFISILFALATWNDTRLPKIGPIRLVLYHVSTMPVLKISTRILHSINDVLTYIKSAPVVADAILLLTSTQIMLSILGTLGPGFADKMLRIDVRDTSLLIIGPMVMGIIIGAIILGAVGNKLKRENLIRTGIISAGSILFLLAIIVMSYHRSVVNTGLVGNILMIFPYILFFLLGGANSMLDIPANSILQEASTGSMRSRIYGLLTGAVGGIGILPVVMGGILADNIGIEYTIIILSLIVLLYGIFRSQKQIIKKI